MASTIISRTFDAIQDNRAVLNASNFARPFNAGNWNKLRVCIRYSVRDTIPLSPTVFSNPKNFAVGICSGSSAIFNSSSTTQFIGASTVLGNSGLGMGRTHPVNNPTSYIISARFYITKKVGSVFSGAAGYGGSDITNPYYGNLVMGQYDGPAAPAAGPRRTLIFVDITRPNGATFPTSGNYLISMFFQGTPGATPLDVEHDATVSEFQTQAISTTPTLVEHIVYNPGVGVTADEITLGALDHVCIAWNNNQNPIEISDVGFVKML